MSGAQVNAFAGWRWLFVLEGMPAVVLGAITFAWLLDWPKDAVWLSDGQRNWITRELESEKPANLRGVSVLETLRSGRVLLLGAVAFLVYLPVTVLALGLGANIAVFTLLSGILLRPLPYAQPDRIVSIELSGPSPYYALSYANMLQLRDAAGLRMQIGALLNTGEGASASVIGPGGRYQVNYATVTAGLFSMLGVQPALGLGLREDENLPGHNHVLLISDDVWRKVFNAAPDVLGKTLTIRRQPYIIVGVLPIGGGERSSWPPVRTLAADLSTTGSGVAQ